MSPGEPRRASEAQGPGEGTLARGEIGLGSSSMAWASPPSSRGPRVSVGAWELREPPGATRQQPHLQVKTQALRGMGQAAGHSGRPGAARSASGPRILTPSLSEGSSLVGTEQPRCPQGLLGEWPGAAVHLHFSLMHRWRGGQVSITSRTFSSNHPEVGLAAGLPGRDCSQPDPERC